MKSKNLCALFSILVGAFFSFCSSTDSQLPEYIPNAIVFYGDCRSNHDIHRSVVAAMLKIEPIVVFIAGDLIEDGYNAQHWEIFNDIVAPLVFMAVLYPCLGNHEYNSPLYFENFELPNNERWYAVDSQNIHFIILDSNVPINPGTEQYEWLKEDLMLMAEKDVFLVAMFHHPPYSSGYHIEDEKNLRDSIVPLFEMFSVDIVFCGHDHFYERSLVNDIYYVVTGGGGAPLHDKERENPYSLVFCKEYHFCRLTVSDSKLDVDVFSKDFEKLDYFFIEK